MKWIDANLPMKWIHADPIKYHSSISGLVPRSALVELARNLKVESVGQLVLLPPIALSPRQTVEEAIRLMRSHGSGCVLLTIEGRLSGIFTEKDLLCRVLVPRLPLSTPLSEVSTQPPTFLGATDPVGLAMALMVENRTRHLPVVDESQRPVGVLTSRILLRFIAQHFPRTIHTLPPRPVKQPTHQESGSEPAKPQINIKESL